MDSNIRASTCAEMPTMAPHVQKLLKAIDEGFCYKEIFVHVARIAENFRDQDDMIPSKKIREAFADDKENDNVLGKLFHSIPRPLLRSLVMGTLAYDLHDPRSPNWGNVYNNGPGTYATAISIEGRHGYFVSTNETEELMRVIHRYGQAIVIYETKLKDYYGTSQLSDSDKAKLEIAMEIDNQYCSRNNEWTASQEFIRPRFASSSSTDAIRNINNLVKMLRARADPAHNYDTGTHHIVSPLYVGCSAEIEKRNLSHTPDHTLTGSSKVWGLTLSALSYLGLPPRVHRVPVVKVWEEEQIPYSEMLVTVLANSLITRGGFNVKAPGTNAPTVKQNLLDRNKREIMGELPFFQENVDATAAANDSHRALQEAYADLQDVSPSIKEIKQQQAEAKEIEGNLVLLRNELNKALDKGEAKLVAMQAAIDKADEAIESSKKLMGLK